MKLGKTSPMVPRGFPPHSSETGSWGWRPKLVGSGLSDQPSRHLMDTFQLILRIAGTIGIILFCFSVAGSLESIAKDLRRLVEGKMGKEGEDEKKG